MSRSGVGLSRPFCCVEHVRMLLQSASSSSFQASIRSIKLIVPCPPGPHCLGLNRKGSDSIGYSDEGTRRQISPYLLFRSRLHEGGASSGGNVPLPRKSGVRKEPLLLMSLVQEVQPLDVSQIMKDASSDSTDAMKRTISGMLGLLPSEQFQVTVETSREPLAKLLVSSMMTGYTLRNAEYRLCLQKSLEVSNDEDTGRGTNKEFVKHEVHFGKIDSILEPVLHEEENNFFTGKALEAIQGESCAVEDELYLLELWPVSEETKNYIHHLKQKLESVSKELEECKRVNSGLQVQNIVGEEKNDLLDYLRSLAPDKVAELSHTSSEVEDVIQHVINELLDNPSTKLHHKGSQYGSLPTTSSINGVWEEDYTKFGSSPLQFQSAVLVNRDYLARLLFWCMLLGHHMRGLEYRLELSHTLSFSGDVDSAI